MENKTKPAEVRIPISRACAIDRVKYERCVFCLNIRSGLLLFQFSLREYSFLFGVLLSEAQC